MYGPFPPTVRPGLRACRRAAILPALLLAALPAVAARAVLAREAPEGAPACSDCHEVDAGRFAASVHGDLSCTDCHAGAEEVPHPETVAEPACAACHAEAVEELPQSVHGKLWPDEGAWIHGCVACHGDPHSVVARDNPASHIHPLRLPATCGSCHSDPARAEQFRLRRVQPVEAYLASVHARALTRGEASADCSSCHGSHLILPATDPRASTNHQKVADTCGACHGTISSQFEASIHGQALAAGVDEAPACTDCHGEHHILSPEDRGAAVNAGNVPKMVCGTCHGNLALAQEFGLDPGKIPSYEDSYHGLAARAGSVSVAHCGSCHGIHDILPSSDPRSHIHKANLAETCGRCHPGAGTTFAIGTVHVVPDGEQEHAAVTWLRRFYLWLIYLVVGGMVLHNVLDFRRKMKSPALRRALHRAALAPPAQTRERLSRLFRLSHGLLAASFIVLAWTGFALKYPEGWWAQPLLVTENLRGWLHRAAAVAMLAVSVLHLVHLAIDRQARACIRAMVPNRHDLREFRERMAWYFGRRDRPPVAPWLGYPEKMEYLAVVWGTAVMALTGFLLWFENLTLRFLPKWWADVATTVHFYEAVLACLAIVVWHFYFVIFDPLVYPMDTAWLTGRSAAGREVERNPEGIPGDAPPETPGQAPQPPVAGAAPEGA